MIAVDDMENNRTLFGLPLGLSLEALEKAVKDCIESNADLIIPAHLKRDKLIPISEKAYVGYESCVIKEGDMANALKKTIAQTKESMFVSLLNNGFFGYKQAQKKLIIKIVTKNGRMPLRRGKR